MKVEKKEITLRQEDGLMEKLMFMMELESR